MAIEGLSHATVLTIMSEVGPDGFEKFKTAKEFTSWLRLAPNRAQVRWTCEPACAVEKEEKY